MKRVLLISLVVLALLAAGAALYIRHYLRSPHVATEVATRLEALYGGPVRVESVNVGISGSSVSGFELFEPGDETGQRTPWLKIGSLSTDISLWALLRGAAMPTHVTVTGARVWLRFDAEGRLSTQFPPRAAGETDLSKLAKFPEVVVEQGELVLQKAGQPDLIARNVNARLRRGEDGKLILSGAGDSAELGKLALSGSLDPQTHEAAATLKANGKVHVTQALLDRLPFIPAATWQELQILDGNTPAALTLQMNLAGGPLAFRIALAPERATVRVPLLDLAAHDVSGDLVIEDFVVHLRHAQGKAYGGEVRLDADLDFSGDKSKLSFPKIALTGLNVAEVPDSWNKSELDAIRRLAPRAKLTGTASVEITIGPGRPEPAAVHALLGFAGCAAGFERWLPAVALLGAFPERDIETRSEGTAAITDVAGGTAEITLKLGPRTPPPGPPKARNAPLPAGQVRFVAMPVSRVLQPGEGAYPEINVKLARAAGELLSGVHTLLGDIVGFGGRLVAQLPKQVEPAPRRPTRRPTST